MYGIPRDIDWGFILGKELEQIIIGKYDVQLCFFGNVVISFYGKFLHSKPNNTIITNTDENDLAYHSISLISLLGSSVIEAKSDCSTELYIKYSNSEFIIIYDDSEYYESISVTYPGFNLHI